MRYRILSLIDSLSVGGAERMAVNISNLLAENGIDSFMCATREEGGLKGLVDPSVGYFFLNKKSNVDIGAFIRLVVFCRKKKINLIHAHSTSVFWAVMISLILDSKVIWHDHFGNSEFLENRSCRLLKIISPFIAYVISVNMELATWANKILKITDNKVMFIPNFAELKDSELEEQLPAKKGRRIVCLANLRPQKDHSTLLKAFAKINQINLDWELLLVGRDFEDEYSQKVKFEAKNLGVDGSVHFLGARNDIGAILNQCDIAVLSSKSEGLPVALLEYGLAGLPVVATAVGEVSLVLDGGKCGMLVQDSDVDGLANSLLKFINNIAFRLEYGDKINQHIIENYSKEMVFEQVRSVYQKALK